jgi:hypothetical protein
LFLGGWGGGFWAPPDSGLNVFLDIRHSEATAMARRRAIKAEGGSSASSMAGRATAGAEQLLAVSAEPISEKVIDAALAGDVAAARFVLDRAIPEPGDRQISFPLRPIETKMDAERAMFDVATAAGEGRITPAEARPVIKVLREFISAPTEPGEIVVKGVKGEWAVEDEFDRLIRKRLKGLFCPHRGMGSPRGGSSQCPHRRRARRDQNRRRHLLLLLLERA